MPIHSELQRAGFLEHVQKMRELGEERVFPELTRGGPDQRYGFYLSKRFATYRKAVGLDRRGADIHSLRSNFATALLNAEVPEATMNELLGHEGATLSTSRYGKYVELERLKEAVDKVRYEGVDLSHLHAA